MSLTINNRFERIGVAKQATAINRAKATEELEHSCLLCCMGAATVECECCPIKAVHDYRWHWLPDRDYKIG